MTVAMIEEIPELALALAEWAHALVAQAGTGDAQEREGEAPGDARHRGAVAVAEAAAQQGVAL